MARFSVTHYIIINLSLYGVSFRKFITWNFLQWDLVLCFTKSEIDC